METDTVRAEITEIAQAIHAVMRRKPFPQALLALLLNLDFMIEGMLQDEPPPEARDEILKLRRAVRPHIDAARLHFFGEVKAS